MEVSSLFFVALVALLTLTAATIDLRTRRVPNWLTLTGLGGALLLHLVMLGPAGLGFALLGFGTGFGLLLILWLIGGAGGGDVKLMGALGAWLGVSLTWRVFLVSTAVAAIAAGTVLVASLMSRGFRHVRRRYLASGSAGRPNANKATDEARRRADKQRRRLMPYAVPVAVGTWLVLALAWHTTSLPW